MGKKLTLKVKGEELTKKDIKERFDKYNKMYFGGKLGKCEILWGLVNNADYGAYHAHEKEDGLHSRIWVGRNTIWTEEGLRELLVHEMIHNTIFSHNLGLSFELIYPKSEWIRISKP